MELRQLDGRCVRLTDRDGTVFEGVCQYDNAEYCEHAFGRAEDGLELENFLFFRSDLRSAVSLEGRSGPYGRFSAPYGVLEELNLRDGIDGVRAELESEEPEHVRRMLRCLTALWQTPFPDRDAVRASLRSLADDAAEPDIRTLAAGLLER